MGKSCHQKENERGGKRKQSGHSNEGCGVHCIEKSTAQRAGDHPAYTQHQRTTQRLRGELHLGWGIHGGAADFGTHDQTIGEAEQGTQGQHLPVGGDQGIRTAFHSNQAAGNGQLYTGGNFATGDDIGGTGGAGTEKGRKRRSTIKR